MYAWAIRKERHGPPEQSMQIEVVPTWPIGDDEVLVLVMAARRQLQRRLGRRSASRSRRSTCTSIRTTSRAPTPSGVVWAVGAKVKRWKVGDEVIVHCNQDDGDDEDCNGGDPMLSPSQRIWGYETPDGSFAQFCRVQSRQLMPKPTHLTWEEAACYTLTLATAYRMLFGHPPHTLKPGDNVLVWGASGGLGVFGVQLAAASGANAIGIISDETKRDYVLDLGAKGVINRKDFKCWGQMPTVNTPEYNDWVKEARKFGKAIWDITGKRDVDIVFEHPGEPTFPVSCLVVKRGGMVVFCAGTTGFNITFDARYVWMRQKRIQGSHFAHLKQASAANQFVLDRRIDPVHERGLPVGRDPGRAPADVEEPAPARQHGGAGERAARRACARSRTAVEAAGGELDPSCRPTAAALPPSRSAAARPEDRRVEFAAIDEDRRRQIEEHQRDHHRGETRIVGDVGRGEFAPDSGRTGCRRPATGPASRGRRARSRGMRRCPAGSHLCTDQQCHDDHAGRDREPHEREGRLQRREPRRIFQRRSRTGAGRARPGRRAPAARARRPAHRRSIPAAAGTSSASRPRHRRG